MITYEMNAANFGSYLGGGSCDGTRLVAGGIELDLAEFAPDAATKALYHLHDGLWTDSSGNGYTLTAYNGAALGEQGLGLDSTAAKYAQTATAVNLGSAPAITLEAWGRWTGSDPANGVSRRIAHWETASPSQYINIFLYGQASGPPRLFTQAYIGSTPTNSSRYVTLTAEQWAAMKTGEFHLEARVDVAAGKHELYLNGSQIISVSVTFPAIASASGYLRLGWASAASTFDGTLDEVRLSTVARHTAAFTPIRRLASGTFTSPAIDSQRRGGRWAPLDWTADLPDTCGLDFEARSGDSLAPGGVDASWQAAELLSGPGRYAQWRATLTRGTDTLGLATPTVESVTATASEAGADLYQGSGADADTIDYDTPVARFGPAVASHDAAGLACPAVHWFGLRSIDAEGRVSRTVDAEIRLELDDAGAVVPARPAPVESLLASGAGGGRVELSWLALSEMGDAPPDVFRIYSNAGSGSVNFSVPLAEIPVVADGRLYQWTSEPLTGGLTMTFAVRAETDAGGTDAETAEVTILIDAAPPRAPGHLAAAPVLAD